MTTTPKKRYSIESIIDRACELGIALSLDDGKLVTQSHNPIPDRAVRIFREYKPEIIAYLTQAARDQAQQEAAYQLREQQAEEAYERLATLPYLCGICLDHGVETVAPYEWQTFMYCSAHFHQGRMSLVAS